MVWGVRKEGALGLEVAKREKVSRCSGLSGFGRGPDCFGEVRAEKEVGRLGAGRSCVGDKGEKGVYERERAKTHGSCVKKGGTWGAGRALRTPLCRCATQEALAADTREGLPAKVKQMGKQRLG
jgi:hypothetical protein